MDDGLRVLAVYDWLEDFDLAKHPSILVDLANDAGISPNKASFYVPEEKKERRRTIYKNSKLIDVVSPFKNYDWMSLDEIVGGNFLNLRSHLAYHVDGKDKRYILARLANRYSIPDVVRHLRLVCQSITPQYGFCRVGDGASAIFFTSGNPTTSMPRETQTRVDDLGDSIYRTKQHLSGKLHDVYELNVLLPPHLEAPLLSGQTLHSWINSGSRGELLKIKEDVFAWLVPEDIRPAVRSTLFKECLLIATV